MVRIKRTIKIDVRLYPDELIALNKKVNRTNLSREEFVRRAIGEKDIRETPPAEYGEIVRELRRIGSNINQLLVLARTHGFVDERKVKELLTTVRSMDECFTDAFTKG